MSWQTCISLIMLLLSGEIIVGQECTPPIVNSFGQTELGTVQVNWIATTAETNNTFNIRYRQQVESEEILISSVAGNSHQLTNLIPGQDYELYIQTNCDSQVSAWNGPYRFRTAIDHTISCGLHMTIRDNGCPTQSHYSIYVNDVQPEQALASVDLTIDHPWPADLSITLVSPSGIEVALVEHKGIFTQDFGSPDDDDCKNPTVFSDLACNTLENGVPNLQQGFRPISPLSDYSSEANGEWTLDICDRAQGDIGIIKGVQLNFIDQPCEVPTLTSLEEITSTSATITWAETDLCGRLIINTGLEGFPINNGTLIYVDCADDDYILTGLLPDTEYDIYIASECTEALISPYSCSYTFRTLCTDPISIESFDSMIACANNCQTPCLLTGLWSNDDTDDIDWIVNSDRTPTEFTGPSEDVHGIGNYLYIENQIDICGSEQIATLQSECLVVESILNTCHLSFAYHRFGQDVGTLSLSVINTSNQSTKTLWTSEDAPIDQWKYASIDLTSYVSQTIQVVFTGTSSISAFGDIAIDEIALLGLNPNDASLAYYRDADGDGYGDTSEIFYGCDFDASQYTMIPGDCNDTNSAINPSAAETPCNGIDENCNGNDDDLTRSTLDYSIDEIQGSLCGGFETGQISLSPLEGTPPYHITWSNGENGSTLSNIPSGIYSAIITDNQGCSITTDDIIVGNTADENYTFTEVHQPTCNGIPDGRITLLTSCEDCLITWSNGMNGNTISTLDAGSYTGIINNQGCLTTTDPILLDYTDPTLAGIQLIVPVSCAGESDGRIIANSITGLSLEYLWSTGSQSASINGLTADTYRLTVTDPATQCSQVITDIIIEEPTALDYAFDDISTNLCPDDANATIQLTAIGGTPPYSYKWNTDQFTDDIFHLSSGEYRATITDSKGCGIITESVNINNPPPINISIADIQNAQCVGSEDGRIDITSDGGSGELSFLWNDPTNHNEEDISNLEAGLYSVTVVDEIGCKASLRNIPVQSDGIQLTSELTPLQEINCHGEDIGELTVKIIDGIPPYNYNWSNGTIQESSSNTDTLSHLVSNSYNVTITDAIGCTSESNTIILDEPHPLTYSLVHVIHQSCYLTDDGMIEVVLTGGTQPYEVNWNNEDSLTLIDSLAPGIYHATVTDSNGCELFITPIEITHQEELQVTYDITDQMNSMLGQIDLTVNGGQAPYTLYLDDEEVPYTESIIDLPAGDYLVSIIDQNSCTSEEQLTIDLISNTDDIQGKYSIDIFPNPTTSSITIQSDEQIDQVQLLTMDGQIIWINQRSSKLVDLYKFQSGIYLVGIVIDGYTFYHKVVKL